MHYPYLDTIVFILAIGSTYWYLIKKPINVRNYLKWKHFVINTDSPFSVTEDRIRDLYKNKLICKMGNVDDSVYFQDKPGLFAFGNIYYVKPGDNGQQITIYYCGSGLKFRVDKTNLKNVISFLGGKVEDL